MKKIKLDKVTKAGITKDIIFWKYCQRKDTQKGGNVKNNNIFCYTK